MLGPIIFFTFIVGFIAIVAWAIKAENKRRAAIEAAANSLGLAFSPILLEPDQALLNTFELAQRGHGRTASLATIADSGELRLAIFDYKYSTGSGKNKQTPTFSAVLATSPDLRLPQFTLTPEHLFHRLGDFFGFKDIDFEEDPKFSDQFQLKGADEQSIRQFFTSERRTALSSLGDVSVEGNGASFLFYRRGHLKDAAQLSSMIEEGYSIYSKLASRTPS